MNLKIQKCLTMTTLTTDLESAISFAYFVYLSTAARGLPRLAPLLASFGYIAGPLPRTLPSEHFAHASDDSGPMVMTGLSRGFAAFFANDFDLPLFAI
jgi:hypothetical protein